jgi:hypothetical protein
MVEEMGMSLLVMLARLIARHGYWAATRDVVNAPRGSDHAEGAG